MKSYTIPYKYKPHNTNIILTKNEVTRRSNLSKDKKTAGKT